MNHDIERPPGVDLESLAPEVREEVLYFWMRYPVSVREEVVALFDRGWRFVGGNGGICLADPNDQEIWVSFDCSTFKRIISGELAWRIDEEAGRGWWTHEPWTVDPRWRNPRCDSHG